MSDDQPGYSDMLVLDTSAVMAVLADEPTRPSILSAVAGHDLIAPSSIVAEVGNGWSSLLKRGLATAEQARSALRSFRSMSLDLIEIDLLASIELVVDLRVYAYDAYPIACAIATDLPLLSLDRGQRHAAKLAGVRLIDLYPFPS